MSEKRGTPSESALRESEARFRSVFESAADGIVIADSRGLITSCNRSAQAIFGYSEDELRGKPITLLMPTRYRIRHQEGLTAYLEGRSHGAVIGRTVELHGLRKDGTEFPIELSIAVWQTAAGSHFSGVLRDITPRRHAEQELKRSYEELRSLSRRLEQVRESERGTLAHAIHEDLGQAFSALKIDIDWLGKRIASPRVSPEALKQRLVAMSLLVDSAIARARRLSADLRPKVLDELGLGAALEWQAKKVQERTMIHCRVSDHTKGGFIDPDTSAHLFRSAQECLDSVARHSGAHTVELSLREEKGCVVLEVRDDGAGIPHRVFHSASSPGFVEVRERSRLMGGELRIEPRASGGTAVIVSVPKVYGMRAASEPPAGDQIHDPGGIR